MKITNSEVSEAFLTETKKRGSLNNVSNKTLKIQGINEYLAKDVP